MSVISFDESGNTGCDLLNNDQPIFVLASSDFSIEEADCLLECVFTLQAKEVKFSKLKNSYAGRKSIIEFLAKIVSQKDRVKTTFYHKKFMIVTKIVDVIVEHMANLDGIDLYKKGANIAMSNMQYYTMPAFCGKDRTEEFHKAFVNMIRNNDKKSIDNFYYRTWQAYSACIDKEYKSYFGPILASENIISEILENNEASSLDPAIPAFFEHCSFWGDKLDKDFEVLHDTSKLLFQQKEMLEQFMTKDVPYQTIGYDRRKQTFPLRSNGVFFGNSVNDTRLQVVDLIAGCCNYWTTKLASGEINEDFWKKLKKIGIENILSSSIWPSPSVCPSELGTEDEGGINAVDYMAEHLYKNKPNKTN